VLVVQEHQTASQVVRCSVVVEVVVQDQQHQQLEEPEVEEQATTHHLQ
jgi:hypothetical protein